MSLPDQLHRIAERAPVADIPHDTWARARSARRRDRALTLAGVVAALALLATAIVWLPERLDPPVADTDGAGVPDHLYAVPERLTDHTSEAGWTSEEVSDDVTIGTGAAAWLTPSGGVPVVVGADGAYHLLDLPGYAGKNWWMSVGALFEPTIALSPDGRSLAYSWAEFGPDAASEPIPSGVRVLDLESGDARTFPLPGDEGTMVETLAWSPDGRWLAWSGARLASWTAETMGGGTPAAGRIDLHSGRREEVLSNRLWDASLGVDGTGRVALGGDARLLFWDGRTFTAARVATTGDRHVASGPDGSWAAPGVDRVTLLDARRTRDLEVGPAQGFGADPLGWLGPDVVVVTDDGDGDGQVVLVPTRGGGPGRSPRWRRAPCAR